MKKIVEFRTKVDIFLLKIAASIALVAAVAGNEWIVDSIIEPVMEGLENFCYGPLDMSRSNAETVAGLIVMYVVFCGIDHFARFSIQYISRLIRNHKKGNETSE